MNGAAAGWSGRMLGPDPGEENLWTGLRFLLGHDCWWPSIQVLEARALAEGVRLPFLPGHEAELPNLYVPLLNIVAGARGGVFVDSALYTGRLLAPELRKEHVLKDHGHLDVVVGESVGREVGGPILKWLKGVGAIGAYRRFY